MDQSQSHSGQKKKKSIEMEKKIEEREKLKNVKQAANSTPNLCRTAASVVNNNLRQNGERNRDTGPRVDDDGQDNNRKQQPVSSSSSSRKYISFF